MKYLSQGLSLLKNYIGLNKADWSRTALTVLIFITSIIEAYIIKLSYEYMGHYATALEDRNGNALIRASIEYMTASIAKAFFNSINDLLIVKLSLNIEDSLNEDLCKRWIKNNNINLEASNAREVLNRDTKNFSTNSTSLTINFFRKTLNFSHSFFTLWSLSGTLSFKLGQKTISVPGHLAWITLIYSVASNYVISTVTKKLSNLNAQKSDLDASIHDKIDHLSKNSRVMKLTGVGDFERTQLRELQNSHANISNSISKVNAVISFLNDVNTDLHYIVTTSCAVQKLLNGDIDIGGIYRINDAASTLNSACQWVSDNSPDILSTRKASSNIRSFSAHIERHNKIHETKLKVTENKKSFTFTGILPNTKSNCTLEKTEINFSKGGKYLIDSNNNEGRVKLMNTIAKGWVNCLNSATKKPFDYLSKEPIFPTEKTTLLNAILYGYTQGNRKIPQIKKLMDELGLHLLKQSLKKEKTWLNEAEEDQLHKLMLIRAVIKNSSVIIIEEGSPLKTIENIDFIKRHLAECTIITSWPLLDTHNGIKDTYHCIKINQQRNRIEYSDVRL
jgi:putative ATP-binding cassette transporter